MKQSAVVTGASSGMGREFVLQLDSFCPSLDEIWVMARRGKRLERLAMPSQIPLRIFEGDITRKKKLLEKQKEGKKRMRSIGSVEVPSEVFMSILKTNK